MNIFVNLRWFFALLVMSCCIIAKGSEGPCDIALNNLGTKTYTFNNQIRLQHQSLLDDIEKLKKKGGVTFREQYLLKKSLREFVGHLKNTLGSQSDGVIHGLIEGWIEKEITRVGYLPGFDNIKVGYRNIRELDDDLSNHNLWPLFNSYFNSAASIQILLYAQRTHRFDTITLRLISVGLPRIWDTLLIREYTLRHSLQGGDQPNPKGKGSIQSTFNNIENELSELLLAK